MATPSQPAYTVAPAPAAAVEATIFPESEHPIREQSLDREALKVLYRLRDAGFKGYLVGGGVRDLFLGKKPKDFDISTDARPGQLRRLFRNSRTIGRRFRLVQVFFRGNKIIEVSTLRSRSEYEEEGEAQLLASNNSFGTLEEDAFRRDLTINALFYEIEGRTVIDYVGGVEDLNRGIIRMVGDPDLRFSHDPVRMLRVVRHAARTGFTIDTATLKALQRHSGELMLCPPSRLRDEILKDLRSGASKVWAEQCMATPLWQTLFPFYQDYGAGGRRENAGRVLLRILDEVDRVYQSGSEEQPVHIDEHFLFAALLLPWAQERFHLPGERLRGQQFHERFSALRDELGHSFGTPFNIPRMAKERISTMLINLSTLHHAGDGKEYPKWLKKKSYYQECRRLYDLYLLGQGRPAAAMAAEDFVRPVPEHSQVEVISAVQGEPSSARGRGGGNPAFSSKNSGVFGLRSKRRS